MNPQNEMQTRQQDGRLFKTSEVLTPGLHQHVMNRYRNKEGREVIMHQNKTHFNTADGTEWTRCDSRTIVAAVDMPKGPVTLPKSTPGPTVTVKPTVKV